MEIIKVNYMFYIDILGNFLQKNLGVLRGAFEGCGCPKKHPDALLAKTMAPSLSLKKGVGSVGLYFHAMIDVYLSV